MRRVAFSLGLLGLVAGAAGCFGLDQPDCAFACDFGAAAQCPSGYSCLQDGYCHQAGHTGACAGFPQQQDATPVQVDAAAPDVPAPDDAAAQDDATADAPPPSDAQHDAAGPCTNASCADGCCLADGFTCIRGADLGKAHCGIGGATCSGCGATSDGCTNGACSCGSTAECVAGQACNQSGVCECNATSCSGCCDSTQHCVAAPGLSACGHGGASCVDCGIRASACDATLGCVCGTLGAACATGQRCDTGTSPARCVCDSVSCASGCCSALANGECKPGTALDACGANGAPCTTCETTTPLARICLDGRCMCGASVGECQNDQECTSGGLCLCHSGQPSCCDSNSCPGGCCDGTTCNPQSSTSPPTVCGTGGGSCDYCTAGKASTCGGSACMCGTSAECGDGQRCVDAGGGNFHCVCDGTSCPGGCCNGTTCVAHSTSACGNAGGA
jgi:hypothetical protein